MSNETRTRETAALDLTPLAFRAPVRSRRKFTPFMIEPDDVLTILTAEKVEQILREATEKVLGSSTSLRAEDDAQEVSA